MDDAVEPKLQVTLAAKVDEDLKRRVRKIARRSGMKEGQLVRLIIERADDLLRKHWKEHVNVSVFIDHLFYDEEKFNSFFCR